MRKIFDVPVKKCKGLIATDFKFEPRYTAENCKNVKIGTMRIESLILESDDGTQYFQCICEKCGYEDILTLYEMLHLHTPYCMEH